jgi:hypothetical protein
MPSFDRRSLQISGLALAGSICSLAFACNSTPFASDSNEADGSVAGSQGAGGDSTEGGDAGGSITGGPGSGGLSGLGGSALAGGTSGTGGSPTGMAGSGGASGSGGSASDAGTGADGGAGGAAGTPCTPITSIPHPSTCACYAASNCPVVNGAPSLDCLWGETPVTIDQNPTCRGCINFRFPNPCHKCKETFNCACLAPYLQDGGSTSQCCDTANGPHLTEYSCQ